jgi:hypothetical protein
MIGCGWMLVGVVWSEAHPDFDSGAKSSSNQLVMRAARYRLAPALLGAGLQKKGRLPSSFQEWVTRA